MMFRYKLLFILLVINSILFAQETDKTVVDFLDSDTLKVNYSMFFGHHLTMGDTVISTDFGGSKDLHSILGQYDESSLYGNKYKFKNRLGSVLQYSGSSAYLGANIYKYFAEDGSMNKNLQLSLLISGVITLYSGVILKEMSVKDLFTAVNYYNSSVVQRY